MMRALKMHDVKMEDIKKQDMQYVATATCSNKNVLCIMYTVALKQLTTGNKNK